MAACQTTDDANQNSNIQETLAAWQGKDVATLITVYGQPSSTTRVPGGTVYSFTSENVIQGNSSVADVAGVLGAGWGMQSMLDTTGTATRNYCTVNFQVRNGTVALAAISQQDSNWGSNECQRLVKAVP